MEQMLLRVSEVAARLGLAEATVRRLIWRGHLPAVRPTRKAVRVPLSAVEAVIALGHNPCIPAQHAQGSPSATATMGRGEQRRETNPGSEPHVGTARRA